MRPHRAYPSMLVDALRSICLAAVGVLGLTCAPDSAQAAASVTCVEASRYTALARITNGDLGRIAKGLGRANERPPANGCRAVLFSGTIDAGSAQALLNAIDQNRGWLATVYLSASNGDLTEEIELAQLLRDFALEVRLLQADASYEPDFMAPPSPLPASVSNGWSDSKRELDSPLVLALQDYRQNYPRLIASGGLRCGTACWTLLAGGLDRQLMNLPAHDAHPPGGASGETADTERVRTAVRARYGFTVTLRAAGAGYATEPAFPRTAAPAAQKIQTACQSRLDYANELQSELGKVVDNLAGRDFPLSPLEPVAMKVRSIQEASDAVHRCAVAAMEQERARAFAARCKEKCDAASLLGPLSKSAQEIVAQARQ
ncbi:MAG TPA: hypothetical protein VM689_09725 [Aliidongia sp.]|nr:hypothetical protein [Aliidongia sp.]